MCDPSPASPDVARGTVVKTFVVLADKFKHVSGDPEAKERLVLQLQVGGEKCFLHKNKYCWKSLACLLPLGQEHVKATSARNPCHRDFIKNMITGTSQVLIAS